MSPGVISTDAQWPSTHIYVNSSLIWGERLPQWLNNAYPSCCDHGQTTPCVRGEKLSQKPRCLLLRVEEEEGVLGAKFQCKNSRDLKGKEL